MGELRFFMYVINLRRKKLSCITCRVKQGSLWQSFKMDHKLSYNGLIWVIQKPNIKFSDAATISMEDTSPVSLFFLTENQSQNLDNM